MGFTQEEISDIRSAIPAQYRADPSGAAAFLNLFSNNATDDHRSQINEATNDAKSFAAQDIERIEIDGKVAIAQGPMSEREIAATKAVMAGEKFNEDRLGIEAGINTRDGMLGSNLKSRQMRIAQGQDRAKADARMQQLLALQAQLEELNFQIGQLEDALGYLTRTGDVEGTMEKPGVQSAIDAWEKRTGRKFDPNDPDAANILKGIIEDDIKAKKEQKAEAEQKAQILNDDIDEKRELKAATDAKFAELSESRSVRDGDLSETQYDQREKVIDEAKQAASKAEDLEERLVELIDKGQTGHIDEVNKLLSEAEEDVLSEVVNNPDKYPEISTRVALAALKEQLSYLDGYKGTPEYQQFVEIALSTVSDEVKEALRNEPDLDEELVAALYEPYSDELEAKGKTEPQGAPENETTKVATVIPPGNHPGMG